jgi:hypothetical protein
MEVQELAKAGSAVVATKGLAPAVVVVDILEEAVVVQIKTSSVLAEVAEVALMILQVRIQEP